MTTETTARHAPGPAIWLQDDEAEGSADCGCRLVCDHDDTLNPAFFFCPMHDAAPALLAACERVRSMLDDLPIAADSPQALILGRHNAYVDLGYAIAQATGRAAQA